MTYIPVQKLEIYILSRAIATQAWEIYVTLEKSLQFSIGNQWIRAVDSIGANISEGYGRYHYKDKIRFYYIARGSIFESRHWLALLYERTLISKKVFEQIRSNLTNIEFKLNAFIKSQKQQS